MRLKTRFDYYKYIFSLEKFETFKLVFSLLIVFYASYEVFSEIPHLKNSPAILALMVMAIANMIWDLVDFLQNLGEFLPKEDVYLEKMDSILDEKFGKLALASIKPNHTDQELEFKKAKINISGQVDERVFYSPKIDKFLRDNKMKYIIDNIQHKRFKTFFERKKHIMLEFLKSKYSYSMKNRKAFFNGNKICLSRDISPYEDIVHIHKSNYYDSYMTNEICMSTLRKEDTGEILYNGTKLFPINLENHNTHALSSITESNMSNHIGVSSLGITKDNYIIMWRQNMKTQENEKLLIPTGSGSADWKDKDKVSFTKTIMNAMNRELYEECSIKESGKRIKDAIEFTNITGYFRWLRRGGKPEFTGISKLNVEVGDIKPNNAEVQTAKSNSRYKITNKNNLNTVIEEILNDNGEIMSPTLYMCLKNLQTSLKENKLLEEKLVTRS